MNWNSKTPWIAATLWIAALPCQAEPREVRIRLQAYTRISPSTLKEAKEVASDVLLQAGVRLSWAECPTSEGEPSKDSACLQPVTPLDLQVRIVDQVMAKRVRRSSGCMGYTLIAGELNSIALAYYHRAVELGTGNLASRGAILGGIMAHEIGHLLAVIRHSEQGLMRAVWQDQDLKTLAKGRLLFSDEQARLIAAAVAKRSAAAN